METIYSYKDDIEYLKNKLVIGKKYMFSDCLQEEKKFKVNWYEEILIDIKKHHYSANCFLANKQYYLYCKEIKLNKMDVKINTHRLIDKFEDLGNKCKPNVKIISISINGLNYNCIEIYKDELFRLYNDNICFDSLEKLTDYVNELLLKMSLRQFINLYNC